MSYTLRPRYDSQLKEMVARLPPEILYYTIALLHWCPPAHRYPKCLWRERWLVDARFYTPANDTSQTSVIGRPDSHQLAVDTQVGKAHTRVDIAARHRLLYPLHHSHRPLHRVWAPFRVGLQERPPHIIVDSHIAED